MINKPRLKLNKRPQKSIAKRHFKTTPTMFSSMFSKFKNLFLLIVIISALNLSACSIFKKTDNNEEKGEKVGFFQDSPQKLYNVAVRAMQANKYIEALERYNDFIVKYPFGDLSEKGRLERIFVLNKLKNVEEASIAADQFVRQYPLHPNVDYAYFMRGVIHFEKKRGKLASTFGGAPEVTRNKSSMEKSYIAFNELITKYPNSQYVPDAQIRMRYLRNKMAEHELLVAKFYAKRNANVGTINRAKYIIENFERAPAIIDTLKLMVSTYQKMGLNDLAEQTQFILDTNYKDEQGITKTVIKVDKPSIWSRLPFKLPNLTKLNPFKKKRP